MRQEYLVGTPLAPIPGRVFVRSVMGLGVPVWQSGVAALPNRKQDGPLEALEQAGVKIQAG